MLFDSTVIFNSSPSTSDTFKSYKSVPWSSFITNDVSDVWNVGASFTLEILRVKLWEIVSPFDVAFTSILTIPLAFVSGKTEILLSKILTLASEVSEDETEYIIEPSE